MKKGIRCNDTRFTNGEDRNQIRYQFLSDDGVTPSSCTVRLGDIDAVTGEPVTNVSFFREYYRVADHQVHKNLYAEKRELTPAEKAWREREKQAFITEFTERWGYAPSRDDILYHLEQIEEERYHLSKELFVNKVTGFSNADWHTELSYTDSMDEDVPPELLALQEVAASLTGRLAEVYEAMIQRAAGEQERVRFSEIADKWGVNPVQITKDQKRIMEMVRRRAAQIRSELQNNV